GEQVRPRAASEPADQRKACDQKQKGGGVEGHLFLLTCPQTPFALSLSKGRSCLQPKWKEGRCFDKLSTNGEGESNVKKRWPDRTNPPGHQRRGKLLQLRTIQRGHVLAVRRRGVGHILRRHDQALGVQ